MPIYFYLDLDLYEGYLLVDTHTEMTNTESNKKLL